MENGVKWFLDWGLDLQITILSCFMGRFGLSMEKLVAIVIFPIKNINTSGYC
jgi:hypothetical protein